MFKKALLAVSLFVLIHCSSGADLQPNEPSDSPAEKHDAATAGLARSEEELSESNAVPSWRNLKRWSFQAGVGFITESTIDEILTLGGDRAHGDAGGQIYLLQVSYKAAEFKPVVFDHPVAVDLELPLVLGVVDEGGRAPFMQYNGGFILRWKTFPWNRRLYTNFETGCGLTYSEHVLATEREQHPNRDRSHLEFYWPIQLMLAHPRHREHQLVLFLHHHSGGLIFHRGGANTLGVGYRFVPGEQ